MYMRILFLLLVLVPGSGSCQVSPKTKQRLDSLHNIISRHERDTNHVKALLEYLRYSRSVSPDTALMFSQEAVEICKEKGYQKFLGRAYNSLAVSYVKEGLIDTALILYDTAVDNALRTKDYRTASLASNAAGYQYYLMVDYTKALEYYLVAYEYASASKDVFSIMSSLNSISSVYFAMRNYELALEYTRKMIAEAQTRNDISTLASSYGNLGAIYSKAGDPDSAIYYGKKCLEIFEDMKVPSGYANYYINCGDYLFKAARYEESRVMMVKGLAMATSGSDPGVLSRAHTLQAKLELIGGRADSALVHATLAKDVAIKTNSVTLMVLAMEVMAQANLSLNRIEDARELYDKVIRLQDSVYDEDNAKILSEMQIRFDTRRSKEQNALLSKENEIQAEKIRQGYLLMLAGGIATILITVVLLLVYRGYKLKKRSSQILAERNKLISQQRDEITFRNKEITDSINYAQRIQHAILPSIPQFCNAAGDAYVYFRPKDIVSGDFYWYSIYNSLFFFAVGDCTGHGVPGGFMSVLGMERLADFAAASNATGEVLGMLNRAIRRSLHQETEASETRDGMDIALCALDRTKRKLHYSGANRPLWIVRDGILMDTSPTKAAIGGLTPDSQEFTSHVIDVQMGDMIYLSTDGYADQFGGESNKKFMTRNFKGLLKSIASLPVVQQEKAIAEAFVKWKGDHEQVDDVLVIGIRV